MLCSLLPVYEILLTWKLHQWDAYLPPDLKSPKNTFEVKTKISVASKMSKQVNVFTHKGDTVAFIIRWLQIIVLNTVKH